jgi:hypothetical protein
VSLVVIALVVVALVGVAVAVLRPGISVTSEVDGDVTITCSASSGVDEAACATWGDSILAAGPPSTTFEMNDLVRLEVSRSMLGFGDCQAAYFLGRYPDSAVWAETVDCP